MEHQDKKKQPDSTEQGNKKEKNDSSHLIDKQKKEPLTHNEMVALYLKQMGPYAPVICYDEKSFIKALKQLELVAPKIHQADSAKD